MLTHYFFSEIDQIDTCYPKLLAQTFFAESNISETFLVNYCLLTGFVFTCVQNHLDDQITAFSEICFGHVAQNVAIIVNHRPWEIMVLNTELS